MNVNENQAMPSTFGVMSIPTLIVFKQRKEMKRIIDAYPKAHIEAMIKRYIA